MKRLAFSRKQILRAIHAACVALFLAASAGHAGAGTATAPFVQSGSNVTTPGASGSYSGSYFTGSGNYTVTISPASSSTATLQNTNSVVYIGGNGGITVSSGITIESTSLTQGALQIEGDGTVNNAGSISGYVYGVRIVGAGGATSVTNTGSIQAGETGSAGYAGGVVVGVESPGAGTSSYSITNNGGEITATTDNFSGSAESVGVGAYSWDGNISVTNTSGAIIGTASGYGVYALGIDAISSDKGNVAVTNSGYVGGIVSADRGPHNSTSAYGISASSNYGNVSVVNGATGDVNASGVGRNGMGYGIYALTGHLGMVTVSNYGTVTASGTGTSSYSGLAYGIDASSSGGNIVIANDSTGFVGATASGFTGNKAYGIYATNSGYGKIAITNGNGGTVYASATSVDGSASSSGIYAFSSYEGKVTVTNNGLAEGTATSTDGSTTDFGIDASSAFGMVIVTNNGTADGSGTSSGGNNASGTGISIVSDTGNVTVTNNSISLGSGTANGNANAKGFGVYAGSVYGNATAINNVNGTAEGTASSTFNGLSATASGYGLSSSSYYGTAKAVNNGLAYGTGSAYYKGTGYGIYGYTLDGNIQIVNNGQAEGEGTATGYPGSPTGTGAGIYAFSYNGDGNIQIVNNDLALGTGTAKAYISSGTGVGNGFGIYGISSTGDISILNNNNAGAIGTGTGGSSAAGAGVYAYSNSGYITIRNWGLAEGSASSNANSPLAYGLYAQSNGPISIINTGTATATSTIGAANFAYFASNSSYSTGLRARSAGGGGIFIDNSGMASGSASVYGYGVGYGYGVNVISTGSANITILNSGTLTGTGSSYSGSSSGYGAWIGGGGSGTISITNAITGVMQGFANLLSSNGPSPTPIGLRLDGGTGAATITNNGTISAYYGVGIYAKHYAGPITLNAIGGAIITTGSGTYSSAYDAVLLGPGNNTANIVGQSNITGLIDGGSTVVGNTLNLHLAGMTPAQKAALEVAVANSQDGAYSGQVFAGGVTYAWDDFENVSGTFVSLEQSVDPGLEELALKIDNLTTPLPVAYGPFYVAAATGSPEAAMNELVGREINQGIDTLGINLNTTLANDVNEHLDNLLGGGQIGGLDLSGLHIGEAGSFYAFSDANAQLDSLLRMSALSLGGTTMSTDAVCPACCCAPQPRWGIWASGNVTLGDESGVDTLSAFHSTLGSPTLGVDYRVCPHLVVGLLGSYTTGDASFDDGSRIGVNTEIGALYGVWRDGNWHVNGIAGGGNLQLNDSRTSFGGTAGSTPRGDDILTDWTGGYDLHLGDRWNITPEAGLQYTHLDINSYSESGAGVFDLSEGGQNIDSLRSHVGFALDKAISMGPGLTFVPELRAQWYHEFMDNSRGVSESLPGAPALGSFSVGTFSPQRDFALVGVGLNTAFTGYKGMPVGLFVNYDAQVGQSDYIANSVNAGIRVDF